MADEPRDLKLAALSGFDKSYRKTSVTTAGLEKCTAAFIENVDRSLASVEFLPLMVGYSGFVNWVATLPKTKPSRNVKTGEVVEIPVVKPSLDNMEAYRNLCLDTGIDDIGFALGGFPEVSVGIEAVLAAHLVSVWTAFEVLAGDLWVAAVNMFPLLGVRALGAEPLPGDSQQDKERKSKKTLSLAAQRVLEPDFDVKGSMGDLLADDFPMTKWGAIIAAYEAIFRHAEVTDIIRDPGLRSLVAVRHVMVHNAGKADDVFCQQVRGDRRFSMLAEKERVRLDGEIASELAGSGVKQGIKLIQYVDRWCANPT